MNADQKHEGGVALFCLSWDSARGPLKCFAALCVPECPSKTPLVLIWGLQMDFGEWAHPQISVVQHQESDLSYCGRNPFQSSAIVRVPNQSFKVKNE